MILAGKKGSASTPRPIMNLCIWGEPILNFLKFIPGGDIAVIHKTVVGVMGHPFKGIYIGIPPRNICIPVLG